MPACSVRNSPSPLMVTSRATASAMSMVTVESWITTSSSTPGTAPVDHVLGSLQLPLLATVIWAKAGPAASARTAKRRG